MATFGLNFHGTTRTSTTSNTAHYSSDEGYSFYQETTRTDKHPTHSTGKPWFVIHMGPPKTATTTIEQEMTAYADYLQKDNYVYLGKYYHQTKKRHPILETLRSVACQGQVYRARRDQKDQPRCWTQMLDQLKEFKGKNLLLSDEEFGFKWSRTIKEGDTPIDWISLFRDISQDWNIVAVIGYRRLAEWLPSARQQNDRWYRGRADDRLVQWPPVGEHLGALFPDILSYPQVAQDGRPPYYWFEYFTDDIIQNMEAYSVPYRMFNLHEKNIGLRTNFICNAVPDARVTCAQSRFDDESGENLQANPGRSDSLFYDAIATKAADMKLIDKSKYSRHEVTTALQYYHEVVKNATAKELPLECPSEDELLALLDASLAKEFDLKWLMPSLSEEEHIDAFWKTVEKQTYCWVDTTEVLYSDEWREVFSKINEYVQPDSGM